jgi:hypothetical protein
MKRIIVCVAWGLYTHIVNAQNSVGVNTTSPQATLDVRGGYRFGGSGNYIKYDSATGRIEWTGAALYVPVYQQIIRHSASAEGLYAGGGKLEYRNTSSPVFYSDLTNGNGYFSGNLGIGIQNATVPLSFASNLGQKISLFSANGTVGFSVESGLFQIHVDDPATDFGFGIRQGVSFTENVRIKGNGNVGIGTNNPAAKLHVTSGTSGVPPYPGAQSILESNGHTYLNILSPSLNESGILFGKGTDGFNGGIIYNSITSPSGFQFRTNGNQTRMVMDAFGRVGIGTTSPISTLDINGSIRLSGLLTLGSNDGTAGQVLQSNGGAAAPTWSSGTNILYNNTLLFTATNEITLTNAASVIPGLSYNFSSSGNTKLIINFDVSANALSCGGCGYSTAYIELVLDGVHARTFQWTLYNGEQTMLTGSHLRLLAGGSHTISVLATADGPSITFGCASCAANRFDTMIVQIIPQ